MTTVSQNQTDRKRGEQENYRPPNPKILKILTELANKARTWPTSSPEPRFSSDEQRVLFRIAQGDGAEVPLYRIQQDRYGRGFMSQITPRIHNLKKRYGFDIRNRQDGESSWYWIVFPDAEKKPKPVQAQAERQEEALFEMGNPIRSAIGL